jgi:hypothetical protein
MYRIELSPGEETVFRSIEELAVAIKRGVITPRARIFHNASGKWLPIGFHPHYKAAVSMPLSQAELVAGPPLKPLSTLNLQESIEPEPPVPIVAFPPRSATATPEPAPKKRTRSAKPAGTKRSGRTAKPRRQLRIALVGALLIGGAQWVLSAPLFSRTEAPKLLHVQRRLMPAPANTAAMVPVITRPSSSPPASFGGNRINRPQPTATALVPDVVPVPVETAASPEIEPAPSTIDVAVPVLSRSDSLAARLPDSSNKKAMKGILRAVSGAAPKEKAPARK